MKAETRKLVEKVARFQNAVDAARDRMEFAANMDAGFDGGEFSGPAHERMFERECDAIAERFGFANAEVAQKVATALGVRAGYSFGAYVHGDLLLPA